MKAKSIKLGGLILLASVLLSSSCSDHVGIGGSTSNPRGVVNIDFNPVDPGYDNNTTYKQAFWDAFKKEHGGSFLAPLTKHTFKNTHIMFSDDIALGRLLRDQLNNNDGICLPNSVLTSLPSRDLPNGWGLQPIEHFLNEVLHIPLTWPLEIFGTDRKTLGQYRLIGSCGCPPGLCSGFYQYCGNLIIINSGTWEELPPAGKEALMFHELAHCVLYQRHRDETVKRDNATIEIPQSIMHYEIDFDNDRECYYKYSHEGIQGKTFDNKNISFYSQNYFANNQTGIDVIEHPRKPYMKALFENFVDLSSISITNMGIIKSGLVDNEDIPNDTCSDYNGSNRVSHSASSNHRRTSSVANYTAANINMTMEDHTAVITANLLQQIALHQGLVNRTEFNISADYSITNITNASEFMNLITTEENSYGKWYNLNRDIEIDIKLIEDYTKQPFNGVFNGNGKSINIINSYPYDLEVDSFGIWDMTGASALIFNFTINIENNVSLVILNPENSYETKRHIGIVVGENRGILNHITLNGNNHSLIIKVPPQHSQPGQAFSWGKVYVGPVSGSDMKRNMETRINLRSSLTACGYETNLTSEDNNTECIAIKNITMMGIMNQTGNNNMSELDLVVNVSLVGNQDHIKIRDFDIDVNMSSKNPVFKLNYP